MAKSGVLVGLLPTPDYAALHPGCNRREAVERGRGDITIETGCVAARRAGKATCPP
jgi:hypothetical protein